MKKQSPDALWRKFCTDLAAAGDAVFSADLSNAKLDEAEGVRYLSRLLRIGLEMNLEYADPAFPRFYQVSHETAKIGADNPDNFYQNATISGGHTYKISGVRGTVPILSFATKANRYAIDGTMASTGELDSRDIKLNSDGEFDIIVERTPQKGNWLPLAEDSTMLLVRQTFFDKTIETPAIVKVECLERPSRPADLTLSSLSSALEQTTSFVSGTAGLFRQWAEGFRRDQNNSLKTIDQTPFMAAGGDPMIHYLHGWWEIDNGEALEITTTIPVCEGWNFQLNNIWMESLDYRYHRIHHNNRSASVTPDGTVKLTVSHTPYGDNWIDTCGHYKGTMLWRWTGADVHYVPEVRKITL